MTDVRSVFTPMPLDPLPPSKRDGHGMKWLIAGPSYLIGVKPLRYHVEDSVEDMEHLFYRSKGTLPQERFRDLGTHGGHGWNPRKGRAHGGQHISEYQRLVVKRNVYRQFVARLKSHYGRLQASFAQTARILRGEAQAA